MEQRIDVGAPRIVPGTVYVGQCKDDGHGRLRDNEGRPVFWVCYETGEVVRLWESFDEWWGCLHWSWTTRWMRPLVKPFAELAFNAGRRSQERRD